MRLQDLCNLFTAVNNDTTIINIFDDPDILNKKNSVIKNNYPPILSFTSSEKFEDIASFDLCFRNVVSFAANSINNIIVIIEPKATTPTTPTTPSSSTATANGGN